MLRCHNCNNDYQLDYEVPDRIWRAIIPLNKQNSNICLPCFDFYAMVFGREYGGHIERLYFNGEKATLNLQVVEEFDED